MRTCLALIIGTCLGYFGCTAIFRENAAATIIGAPVRLSNEPIVSSNPRTIIKPWSSLAGRSTIEYVSNLRNIGCPSETISDIIFYSLLREADAKLEPALRMNIEALQARQNEVLQEMNAAGLPDYNLEPDYFLSPKQLKRVKEGLQSYPIIGDDTNASERLKSLGDLNNEQIIYYKSEFEHYGPTIVNALTGFRPTQQEYYAMVNGMSKNQSQALLDKLPQLLVPSRYQQFVACHDPVAISVYSLCTQDPSLRSKEAQMIELLSKRTSLSVSEFRRKAIALVGPGKFEDFISIGSTN